MKKLKSPTLPEFFDRPSAAALWTVCLVATLVCLFTSSVRANVYATNVRINGGTTNIAMNPVTNVVISYLLNEDASAGVNVEIKSGATTVRNLTVASGAPGAVRGTNSVIWDGKNNSSQPVGGGTYTVSVSAASVGYASWTELSSEIVTNFYVWEPRGIVVNKNSSSPKYGRIFVGNASEGPNTNLYAGDRVGIQKFNADASPGGEGLFSTGGYDWAHGDTANDNFSPWKMEIGADDRLYVSDFFERGVILSFDQAIASNSLLTVLTNNNYPSAQAHLDGFALSGSPGNMQLWMADSGVFGFLSSPGVGIRRWNLTAGGVVASNDLGITVVQVGGGSDLTLNPNDLALDQSNRIYTVTGPDDSGNPAYRVFRFPTYAGTIETNADWKKGNGDDFMSGASGVSVDPSGTYLAVAFRGVRDFNSFANGATRLFYASNGVPVTGLTLQPGDGHDAYDVAWDNVGNLYTLDGADGLWRIFSPPGTNSASTVAIATVQVPQTAASPILGAPTYDISGVHFTLFGEANVSYIIQASTNLVQWAPVLTNTSTLANRPITVPANGDRSFYRARVSQ